MGRYESQLGHDDVAMSCVNLVSLFESSDYYEMVEDIYDKSSEIYKSVVENRMERGDKIEDEFLTAFKLIKEYDAPSFQQQQNFFKYKK